MWSTHCLFCLSSLSSQDMIENPSSIFDKHLRYADASSSPDPLYCPLKEALMLCAQTFNVKSSAVHANDFKRVWLFTTDDSPNSHKPSLQSFIVQVSVPLDAILLNLLHRRITQHH